MAQYTVITNADGYKTVSGIEYAHEYVDMPQCVKCGAFEADYEYVGPATQTGGVLVLTCRRCDYSWGMSTIPEDRLT